MIVPVILEFYKHASKQKYGVSMRHLKTDMRFFLCTIEIEGDENMDEEELFNKLMWALWEQFPLN